MRFILIIMFISTLLHAEYLRTIRISTYLDEVSSKEALVKLQEYVATNKLLAQLQKKYKFQFKQRKSGKYFITLAEPFRNKEILQKVLDNLRLIYPDIYVTRLNSSSKVQMSDLEQPTLKTEITPDIEVFEPLRVKNNVKQKDKNNSLIKQQSVVHTKESLKSTDKELYFNYNNISFDKFTIIVFLFLILLICILLILVYRYKKQLLKESKQRSVLEKQLKEFIQKLENKDKVFSHTSHELRNPMSAIIGLSQLLLEEKMPIKQKEYVEKIEGSAKYLLEIINDILDLSKMEAGALKIEYREFNLNHVIRHVINIISVAARENGTRVELDIDNNLSPYIMGDSLRLTQILINLLSNAVKFTKNGIVILSVRKTLEFEKVVTVEFIIKDNGIGMTQSQLKNIFHSYTQATTSTTREYGGTGLGLSIVKYLVDIMHGDIHVESKKHHGTTFVLHLKFEISKKDERRFYRLPNKEYLEKNVLLIESSSGNIEKLKNAFAYFNYIVYTVSSLDETFLDSYQKCDIVIINKEFLNEALISQIKIMKYKRQIKFILFSDSVLEPDKELIKKLDIDAYLTRPFTQEDVLNVLKSIGSNNRVAKTEKISFKEKLKNLANKRILIADDNILNHKVLAGILLDTSLELIFVENGEDVLDILKNDKSRFDLIILDINMPKLNGYETALEIKKLEKFKDIPIVALTADLTQDSVNRTNEVGMKGHIAKPIIVEQLYEKLYTLLLKEELTRKKI